jgi:vacuolar-type H+-ATPase subunit H
MSLQSITQITEAEEAARRLKFDAQSQARRDLDAAEMAGREAVERARRTAEDEGRALRRELEHRAADNARELAEETLSRRAVLRAHADARLDAAARIIVDAVIAGQI